MLCIFYVLWEVSVPHTLLCGAHDYSSCKYHVSDLCPC